MLPEISSPNDKSKDVQIRADKLWKGMANLKTRVKIALAMVAAAFMLWLGAAGNADFNGDYSLGDYIRIGVGLLLATIAFPLGGGDLTDYRKM